MVGGRHGCRALRARVHERRTDLARHPVRVRPPGRKVLPEDAAARYLARGADAFVLSGESDAFIADGDEPTVADCVHGIETQPVTALPLADLAGERPFCVRSGDRKEIVIARLTEAPGDGSVTIALDRHHREG
ncbi:hypothetical protein [Streptomyces sp. NPDC056194]|uniref:hypothetical protein n=1 Tax=unclassified Streptomyces TaxID=2593676 RepID=UPI0035E0C6AA